MPNVPCNFKWYALLLWLLTSSGYADDHPITIGSKKFTEGIIIGEIAAQAIRAVYPRVIHRRELGGTRVLWGAIKRTDIDIYGEYTGTLVREIFAQQSIVDDSQLDALLAQHGLAMTRALGFNNTYVLGMVKANATALKIRTIADLISHPTLIFGFGNEFMQRGDGWPGLRERYGLPQTNVRGMDHDIAYRGLVGGDIDVMDLYSTDAEIQYYDLVSLIDDRHYFPRYDAVILYRQALIDTQPQVVAALRQLEAKIDSSQMIALNAQVKLDKRTESEVAAQFLKTALSIEGQQHEEPSEWLYFWRNTGQHLILVGVSLLAAISIAIPLGIVAAKYQPWGRVILTVVGIFQTIPSLALFVFMLPVLGIGAPPAIVALFLYSLLPIVRNTHSGLTGIATPMRHSATVLGLNFWTQLRVIELPLALPSIMAGIKTAAVINIGTATLGALIGAGGYGQPILTGIRLDDYWLIFIHGAIPAAIMALLVQALFEVAQRKLVPVALQANYQK